MLRTLHGKGFNRHLPPPILSGNVINETEYEEM